MHMHIDNKHKTHVRHCKAITAPTPISGDSFASTSTIGCFGRGTARCICRGWKLSLLCLRHANWWLLAREWWERTTATGGERKCHCRAFGMRPGATWSESTAQCGGCDRCDGDPDKLSRSTDSNCISRMWCTRLHLQRPNPLTSRLSVTKGTSLYLCIYIYTLILWYRSVASSHYVFPAPFTLMRTARFQTGLCFPWESGGRDWEWTGRPHLGW